jgi:hypothetical protein
VAAAAGPIIVAFNQGLFENMGLPTMMAARRPPKNVVHIVCNNFSTRVGVIYSTVLVPSSSSQFTQLISIGCSFRVLIYPKTERYTVSKAFLNDAPGHEDTLSIAAPRLRPLFKDKQIVEGSDGCWLFVDNFFTREYTKCTAGSTFCFVVVVVVLGKPLIKLASISADS